MPLDIAFPTRYDSFSSLSPRKVFVNAVTIGFKVEIYVGRPCC